MDGVSETWEGCLSGGKGVDSNVGCFRQVFHRQGKNIISLWRRSRGSDYAAEELNSVSSA